MRLLITAIGRLKDGPERILYRRYAERIDRTGRGIALGPLDLVEIGESRAASAKMRADEEAQRLLDKARGADLLIALDERGRQLSSAAFAGLIRDARDRGVGLAAFLIGGPDGHGEAVRKEAGLMLSLGLLTLPHGLTRLVLTEQLYRAVTILSGHPYHRY
ncbi:MAG TPA: 23S rRNA (pseudouridine(1915)-N(3))-methyltransferase RlmH [Hyphomicrobiaceae bacterium]|nr:23S rRNA (pseudouridine(1915)-N(3))-methyltransferase RlmH [Hyphomicrobiaceae bacterium]